LTEPDREAIATGESVPVEKGPEPVAKEAVLADRSSMLWSGTFVSQGTARGLVVATGSATEIGRIGNLLGEVEQLNTPLVTQMDYFARWLSFLILLCASLLLVYGFYVGHLPFSELFMVVVGIAVAAIPEGLPAVMTITLAIGVRAMARRSAIVRRLPAIEAIGSVSVICTDKTGTLTRNEMVVAIAETPEGIFSISGEGYSPEGAITPGGDLNRLALAAALCNDSHLHRRDGIWAIEGDPMEGALRAFAGKVGGDHSARRLDAVPFDSRHRFMAVLTEGAHGRLLHVKGAPERVLRMCPDLNQASWHTRAEALAKRGLRVLALAGRSEADIRIAPARLHEGLGFLGLVGLIDPPRPEAIAAVREGRTVADNLRKVISWTLPTNAGESAVIVLALLLGLALPVTAVQILWVNLITAVTLGLSLAFEPTEPGTMNRPPRNRHAPILSGELVWHVFLVTTLFLAAVFGIFNYAIDKGHPLALAQTMAMNTLIVLEIFHLFFIRNLHGTSLTWGAVRGTRVVWTVVISIAAAQFAVTYLPPMQAALGTTSVPLVDGLLIVGVGAAFFVLIEIEKQIRLGVTSNSTRAAPPSNEPNP